MSVLTEEIAKLAPSARIELYVIDATELGGDVLRFHNGTNALKQPVVWQGDTYTPMPIEADGFDVKSSGPAPRPKIRVSNVFGLVGLLVMQYGGLEGALVIRKVTHARFLDAVNFPGGVNAEADPTQQYPDDVWKVDRVSRRDRFLVEWELASPFDLEGVEAPSRQVDQLICPVEYRGADCGYTGGPVAKADDTPTSDPLLDKCSQKLSGCKLRWEVLIGGVMNKELPFGGFPGAGIVRSN